MLVEDRGAATVAAVLRAHRYLAAPDVLVPEALGVLRRQARVGELTAARATAAATDLGDLAIDLMPSLRLRHRAWMLRHNFTVPDALFVALAEYLNEPLLTKDRRLAVATRLHTDVSVIEV